MATTVGGKAVDLLQGLPQLLRPRVNIWEVPGVNGYGANTLGNGNAEFQFTTVKYYDNNADAETGKLAFLGLQGKVVSIVDDWTTTYPNVLIQEAVPRKFPCIWQGNLSAVRLEIQWKAVTSS